MRHRHTYNLHLIISYFHSISPISFESRSSTFSPSIPALYHSLSNVNKNSNATVFASCITTDKKQKSKLEHEENSQIKSDHSSRGCSLSGLGGCKDVAGGAHFGYTCTCIPIISDRAKRGINHGRSCVSSNGSEAQTRSRVRGLLRSFGCRRLVSIRCLYARAVIDCIFDNFWCAGYIWVKISHFLGSICFSLGGF